MARFEDDNIMHFESDIEKIQNTPAQYISYMRDKGALHLAKEIINNMIDECISPKSPGNYITVYLDEVENTLICSDNGRGLPFDKMELVCTTLQSGSKFTRDGSGTSAGQNGVGLCAVNAMSDAFSITSFRYGERADISFERGQPKEKLKITKTKEKENGTIFSFKPSEFYLNGPCPIKSKELVLWIEKLIHQVPHDITLKLSIRKKGKEAEVIKEYRNKNGLYDFIMGKLTNPAVDPVHFLNDTHIIEHDKGKDTERFLGIEIAFSYEPGKEYVNDSFCNFVNTVEGGCHVDAAKSAVTTFLAKKTRESLSEAEAKKLDISVKDATDGLHLMITVATDCHPQFTGQTKEKVGNDNLYAPIKDLTLEGLEKYFIKNPKILNKIISIVKLNAKARLQMDKAKKSVLKTETGALSDHKIAKLLTCNNRGKEYKEIFLVEGDSARGSFEDMRDDNTQAAFSMKGVPLNTYGKSVQRMLLNDEIKQMVTAFGCNIGDKFDIKKLKYNKIIILTDSDVDGSRICSLLCLFFVMHMPQIIEEGLLYRALPPLYTVRVDGKKVYVRSKAEFVELTEEKISKVYTIALNGNNLARKDLMHLLLINRQYKEEIDRVADKLPLHPEIVEFICRYYGDRNFVALLNKRFPELEYIPSGDVIEGVYDGQYQTVILDDVTIAQFKNVKKCIHNDNKGVIDYEVIDKKTKEVTKVTLYQFFKMIEKYEPKIEKRFKGLGELKAEELWETTLNPTNRTLLRFTMDDALDEADKFKVLHGPESETKKLLMKGFKINKDDLDN